MVGSANIGDDANEDGDMVRVRTIIVAGQSSQRTRNVLQALRGFTNVIWPKSLESALEQAAAADAACLVIADGADRRVPAGGARTAPQPAHLRDHRSRRRG
jgi:hypothetical protein